MFSPKTILVPVDFSDRSNAAAEHANVMAKRFGSNLIFVHVIPRTPYEFATFEGGYYVGATWPKDEELEASTQHLMDRLVEKAASKQEVQEYILRGDPARKIVEFAEDRKADLIIMPTHGYGPFRRFVLGSVTSKVLHDVSCPVFTGAHVPGLHEIHTDPYKRVACAIDLSDDSERVLRWAWDLALACEEDLIVIHAAPSVQFGATYADWFPMDARDLLVQGATERLEKLIDKVGCKAELHVESAHVVPYIREAADDAYADILVIGRKPGEGVLGRLRTHAYALIREAPCPVISV